MAAPGREVAGYIAAWRPSSVPAPAAAFARQAAGRAGPATRARANALLWAAARLAGYAVPPGLDPVPEVLLHPSVIERFAVSAPGLPGSARRTLRTNLRFIAREVVPALAPVDAPLPRERAKAPYSAAEIAGYLALADAQPTVSRRPAAGGAGAGPLPRTAAGRRGVRRDRTGHRRHRPRAQERDDPADPVAVRRGRAAPAGGLPAADDLAA